MTNLNTEQYVVEVKLHSRWTEAYSRFLSDNDVPALISMTCDRTTFRMSAEDEIKIRELWNPQDYAQYVWN